MPKATFFNLADDKRERITAVAIDEFGRHEYADVSISRIVARAEIAKGSFYQYFEDKEDLYGYLLDLIVQKKKEVFSLEHPDPQHMGIFHYLHWFAQAGVAFELAYPDLARVGYRALNQTGLPRAFAVRADEEAQRFYARLVQTGKEQGDIPAEIDEDLAAFLFHMVFAGLGQYLLKRFMPQGEADDERRAFFEHPEVTRIFRQTIDILQGGMGAADATHVDSVAYATNWASGS